MKKNNIEYDDLFYFIIIMVLISMIVIPLI